MHLLKISSLAVLCCAFVGCSDVDDDYFPYKMTGLNAWLYDSVTEQEYLAGFTAASYENRESALRSCAAKAAIAAAARNLEEWSYVCCTVTEESQCATKVR